MSFKAIAIGADHAGFSCKEATRPTVREYAEEVIDVGTFSEASVDYPDFSHQVALKVESGQADLGILFCGSGNGVCIAANRHKGVRGALCWTPEIAKLARNHNNANVLCIPARFVSTDEANQIIKAFLEASFEGGRHAARVDKIEFC